MTLALTSKEELLFRELVLSSYRDVNRRAHKSLTKGVINTIFINEMDSRLSKLVAHNKIYNYKVSIEEDMTVKLTIQKTRITMFGEVIVKDLTREQKINNLLDDI